MEQQGNGGGVVNMTRAMEALSPLLNEPRRKIIQVEALVTTATTLLFLQLVLGSCRRCWHNSFVKGVLSTSNAVMFPLIIYTFSLMQSSPIKSSLYPVLGISLLIAAGGTNAVNKYDFHDNKKLMGYFFEMARYLFYLFMLRTLLSPVTSKQFWRLKLLPDNEELPGSPSSTSVMFLMIASVASTFSELLIGFVLSKLVHNGYLLAKWMNENANDHQDDSDDPESLKGYSYLVTTMNPVFGTTTVDQIWNCCSSSDNGEALKEVCLSFALFELLKRRYYGFVCAEARLPKTKDFVFKCLLPTENDYKRAFRIIEMELRFCYDFFFTKYYLIYTVGMILPIWLPFSVSWLFRISLIFAVGVYTIKSSLILETTDPIIEVHSTKADYNIAVVVLSTVLTVELLQAAFYLASDWFKVWLASWYVSLPNGCIPDVSLFDKVIGFLRKITMPVRLRNMVGQYSVISVSTKKPAEDVTDTMKLCIARSLISTKEANLTNGETSLRQNLSTEMFEQYRWALMKNHHQVELMLIWHITTDYCDLALTVDGVDSNNHDDREIAVKLSRYCAYLIAYIPELLPYHTVDIKRLRSAMKTEVRRELGSIEISERRYREMKNLERTGTEDNAPRTIFRKGVKLGKQLEFMQDGKQRWKVLADFWAETLIYIAPSHMTVKHHMEQLENGGEFLTYIWAMLSHAGILNIKRDKDDEGTDPDQFSPGIV